MILSNQVKAGETRGNSKESSGIDSVLTLKAVLGKKQALVSVFKFNFFKQMFE